MTEVQRIKKKYTIFNLLVFCSIVLMLNLIFSSSPSQTDIIKQESFKRSEITKQDIVNSFLEQQNAISIQYKNLIKESEYIVKKGSIEKQPIYCELREHGIDSSEILKLSEDFKQIFNFRKARKGDEYSLFFSSDKQLQKIIYERGLLTQYIAKKNNDGRFDVVQSEILLTKKILVKEFILKDSLFQAILSGDEGNKLAFEFAEIFSWDIDFFLFPRQGDVIQIEFEKFSKDGQFVKYGKILAARYLSKEKIFSTFLFNDGKYENYYDENGNPMKKMFLRVPIKSGHVTSSFSLRRFHPVLKKYRRHTGIDYGGNTGTPIFATANGKVKFSGWVSGYGKLVIIVHPNGYETYYGHCSKLLVKPGKYVSQGEVIAKIGSTGHATGPHIHYEVKINKQSINPNTLKSSLGEPIDDELIPEFKLLVSKKLDSFESNIEDATSKIAI